MASFKAKFPVLQELFAKNHRGGPFGPPPSGARVKSVQQLNVYNAYYMACEIKNRRAFYIWLHPISPKYIISSLAKKKQNETTQK